MMGYHLVYEEFYPLVEMDSMRRKDGWPNVFFEANSYRRPLWLPPANFPEKEEINLEQARKDYREQMIQMQGPALDSKQPPAKAKPSQKNRKKAVNIFDSGTSLLTGKK